VIGDALRDKRHKIIVPLFLRHNIQPIRFNQKESPDTAKPCGGFCERGVRIMYANTLEQVLSAC